MTEPAVLQATYSDFKLIKTRSVISLGMELPIEHADQVMRALGMPVPGSEITVAICRLNLGAARHGETEGGSHSPEMSAPESARSAPPPKGPHSDYAQALYKCRFMRNLNVCQALGTEADYKAWIQKQESCVSGKQDYIGMESGEMRCEESHVERVSEGHGKGIKAPYHSVPLTHDEHKLRHQHGELALFDTYTTKRGAVPVGEPAERERQAKWFFENKAIEYREKWVRERLCAVMQAESLTDIDPEKLRKWCESKGVEEALPK